MNLSTRLKHKTTCTVQILSSTKAIYSNEVSNHEPALSIVEARSKKELWNKIIQLATVHAEGSGFAPRINLCTEDAHRIYDVNTHAIKVINVYSSNPL